MGTRRGSSSNPLGRCLPEPAVSSWMGTKGPILSNAALSVAISDLGPPRVLHAGSHNPQLQAPAGRGCWESESHRSRRTVGLAHTSVSGLKAGFPRPHPSPVPWQSWCISPPPPSDPPPPGTVPGGSFLQGRGVGLPNPNGFCFLAVAACFMWGGVPLLRLAGILRPAPPRALLPYSHGASCREQLG